MEIVSRFLSSRRYRTLAACAPLLLLVSVSCGKREESPDARRSESSQSPQAQTQSPTAESALERANISILQFAWHTELGESAFDLSIDTLTGTMTGTRYNPDFDMEERFTFNLIGIGDPDHDGNIEASVGWTSSLSGGVSGWGKEWGVVQDSVGYRRKEPWSDELLNTAQDWCGRHFPDAENTLAHLIQIDADTLKVTVYAWYPGDAHCCPKFRGHLTYQFDSTGTRPEIIDSILTSE